MNLCILSDSGMSTVALTEMTMSKYTLTELRIIVEIASRSKIWSRPTLLENMTYVQLCIINYMHLAR